MKKRISEASRLTGVSRRTLQYYDEEGLLQVERSKDHYRLYEETDLERVWQILLYKEMGFELKDIRQLLDLPLNQRNQFLEQQIEVMKQRIAHLEAQIAFISMVKKQGMLPAPDQKSSDKTYVEHISELKETWNMKNEREE